MYDVIVAGAGPVGLFLAAELRLAGVGVTVLERRTGRPPITKGVAMHARTLELLATNRRMLRAAAVQGVAPLIALISLFF